MINIDVIQRLVMHACGGRAQFEGDNCSELLSSAVGTAIGTACESSDIDDAPSYMTIPEAFVMGVKAATIIINDPLLDHREAVAKLVEAFRLYVIQEAETARADRKLVADRADAK